MPKATARGSQINFTGFWDVGGARLQNVASLVLIPDPSNALAVRGDSGGSVYVNSSTNTVVRNSNSETLYTQFDSAGKLGLGLSTNALSGTSNTMTMSKLKGVSGTKDKIFKQNLDGEIEEVSPTSLVTLATVSQINTGSDTAGMITPDLLNDSKYIGESKLADLDDYAANEPNKPASTSVVKQAMQAVSGMVILWDFNNTCPTGFTRLSTMDNFFIEIGLNPNQASGGINGNGTGGTAHVHTAPAHSHTLVAGDDTPIDNFFANSDTRSNMIPTANATITNVGGGGNSSSTSYEPLNRTFLVCVKD